MKAQATVKQVEEAIALQPQKEHEGDAARRPRNVRSAATLDAASDLDTDLDLDPDLDLDLDLDSPAESRDHEHEHEPEQQSPDANASATSADKKLDRPALDELYAKIGIDYDEI